MADPNRGEIWLAALGVGEGHEQSGNRPVLVISTDRFNMGLSSFVIAAPLTSQIGKSRSIAAHILIRPPEAGLRVPSSILCDQVRSISKSRLVKGPWGTASHFTMNLVEDVLRNLMGL